MRRQASRIPVLGPIYVKVARQSYYFDSIVSVSFESLWRIPRPFSTSRWCSPCIEVMIWRRRLAEVCAGLDLFIGIILATEAAKYGLRAVSNKLHCFGRRRLKVLGFSRQRTQILISERDRP